MQSLFPRLHKGYSEWDDTLFKKEPDAPKSAGTGINEIFCSSCKVAHEEWDCEEFMICKLCGEIENKIIDSGAEYRFFGADDRGSVDPCRVGAPTDPRFPTSTLGTMILSHAHGGNSTTRMAMARVRRYHSWNLLPYKERSLLQVFEQIALAATNNGFDTRTMDIAKDLYVKLVAHCDRRGMSRTSVVASCLYSALKMVNQPRKPKEVADMFHLSIAQFTKSMKYFQEILCMATQRGLLSTTAAPASFPTTRSSNYIANPLSRLPITRKAYTVLEQVAVKLANEIEDIELCPENMPPSLAAGVLALVIQESKIPDIPNERIAGVCGVSEGTLNKCLKKLDAALKAGTISIQRDVIAAALTV
uniref:Transcription factor TFIIB cyclin-like domain-containing protein n=1 Tax=viral metagenome TaxID=1070528 RepID=A0A6C0JVP1_9ZZZZ